MKPLLETPYRGMAKLTQCAPFSFELLFAAAGVPLLVVDVGTHRIVEANLKAINLLGTAVTAIRGAKLASLFESAGTALLQASLEMAQDSLDTVTFITAYAGASLQVTLSMFRTDQMAYILVRLKCLKSVAQRAEAGVAQDSVVLRAIDGAPFGFLMTDAKLRIDYANQAFLGMVNMPSQQALIGQPLMRWLPLSAPNFSQLSLQLSQRQAVSRLTSRLHRFGQDHTPCEVYAIGVPAGAETSWGFCVSQLARLN